MSVNGLTQNLKSGRMRSALDTIVWKIKEKELMLRKIMLARVLIASFLFVPSSVLAQNAKLIEAAKKEGKAIAYGSLESDTMEAIVNAFKKKTGLEVEYWRASATKVMDRALSEARAGRRHRHGGLAADLGDPAGRLRPGLRLAEPTPCRRADLEEGGRPQIQASLELTE